MWQHVHGSDHCPVFAEFDLTLVSSQLGDNRLPALCSRWFTAKQSKLSAFMSRHADKGVKGGGAPESRGTKRTINQTVDVPPPPAKAKKTVSQKTLFSYSVKSKSVTTAAFFTSSSSSGPASDHTPLTSDHTHITSSGSSSQLSAAWRGVFGAPPKAPLCSGHSEACVLRRVKKQGPNKDREFWVCARPGGAKNDPQAKCDFFKWAKEK